ncbi:MAG TPA: glycosyltransferase family 4 protein [Candidatus Paceibacterota bacterium]|nr:glycosyltransferase family 4 protein [Candidatus Paceibacterota bacterium]
MALKILYAAFARMPTEKAHGAQIMHTCAALGSLGCEVLLALPGRKTAIAEDPFAYYRVERTFKIVTLPVLDLLSLGRIGFLVSSFLFALRAASRAKREGVGVAYTRDRMTAFLFYFLLSKKITLAFEAHGQEPRGLVKLLSRRALFVGITNGVKEILVERGAKPEAVLVAHDGVSLEDFARPESKEAARARLGLPQDEKIALYIGRLDGWKGAQTLLEASNLLPKGVLVAIIGGEAALVGALRAKYPRARFLGYHEYRELPGNQAAADALVLPNTARDITSARYTSPLKLFSYMASGRPIVASDLPSLREVISEESAYFAKPDDPKSLADAIMQALNDERAESRAQKAKELVSAYDWRERGRSIKEFIEHQRI